MFWQKVQFFNHDGENYAKRYNVPYILHELGHSANYPCPVEIRKKNPKREYSQNPFNIRLGRYETGVRR
jgi:hypothetical protein